MTPEFERLLGLIDEDIKKKENLSPAFSSLEKVEDYLDSL